MPVTSPFYPTIGIIGAGRVGSALAHALYATGYTQVGIASRSPAHAAHLADSLHLPVRKPAELLAGADLVFLAVSDDALASLATELSTLPVARSAAVVHCSGALSTAVLAPLATHGWTTGSCHPMQAFAPATVAIQPGITWGIEAAEPLRATLHQLVATLGGRPLDLRAEDKVLYHAAAVLAANFSIILAAQAVEILGLCAVPPEAALQALLPLLQGNLANLAQVGLPAALTGPLARGDWGTIKRHLAALDARSPSIATLYRACSAAATPLLTYPSTHQDYTTGVL